MLDAANAFAQSEAPFKSVIFDDGCEARDLTDDEERLLANVCDKFGLELEEADS